jgi:pSer/pThr/pTyr-binding forkhead associated (FHA) protein
VPVSGETTISGASIQFPVLVVTEGARAGERLPVTDELSLGRENADVVLDDPEVSRWHAVVRLGAGGLEISDAGSANGTFVNGSRIEGVTGLADGDSIRVGTTTLAVEVPVARQPETATPPVLVVTEGADVGRRLEVERELSLGRWDADAVLNDMEVSRRHAVVRFADGSLEISDTNSANGTFVNGSRIDGSQQLADGDLIRLGKTTLKVELPRTSSATVIAGAGTHTVVTPPPGT